MAKPQRIVTLPQLFSGLKAAWLAGYSLADLRQDILAGITIGTVALPLSMALAIATGVPPQHGLYTAIIAGAIIAITGGSRYNVSGPTAAFVVILFPIVQQYGLGGLLIATMMAGVILIALGIARMGRLIQFVPYPVILGFTAGIAVVIAVLQLPDFFGLTTDKMGEHFITNLTAIIRAMPTVNSAELSVGIFTLALLLIWPKFKLPIPAALVGLIAAAFLAYLMNHYLLSDGSQFIETIASRFSWTANDETSQGIPPIPPTFVAPWNLPGADGKPLEISFDLIVNLAGPAFAIAMLGAIESLLCAVVADGLTKTKHDPNAELIGQGLGNIAAPLFGGITATAALARTATNIRSGARSPIAAVVHSLVVLLAVVALAGLLGLVPMAALAALLFIIAWNMSEARHFVRTIRTAPGGDVAILLVCFGLTVLFDMVLAVAVGIGLAGALFIQRMANLTSSQTRHNEAHPATQGLPPSVIVYDVNGPLFFGVAEKALSALERVPGEVNILILDMQDVPSIDGTAINALHSLVDEMQRQRIKVILVGLPARMVVKLSRAGIEKQSSQLTYCRNLQHARDVAERWLKA
ncbi:C4-dicarboxylic acid transporter DauA [Pseudidiomarina tainanensis]|uniref:C4-dicarboxylic acid transporter DauA n=1 Tax=Pseudidiomarina tainanensis TaxID=502365 RepID=A0ACD2HJZ8_9GAMM|nr:C4-dicarboxylic acid transporter DauA [Pseudidiomarina tainanensis]RZQ56926.1 C4-dicarboxylic acid transporter DauA [Pseudidiomarina tainanensis]